MIGFDLDAADGHRLAARLFSPSGGARGGVVVLGATGVAQRWYGPFAEALRQSGFEVLTVDVRGIGASRPPSLRGFTGTLADWVLDADAAVEFMLRRGPTAVVGHSFGGHAFGQLSRPNATRGLFTVGTGAAWSGYMAPAERLKVEAMWQVLGPIATRVAGYLPGRLWGGEDLPLGVYRDWRRWSRSPRYFFDDAALGLAERFARVRVPVHGVTASDDAWAPRRSMEVLLAHYRNARVTLEVQTPSALGVSRLGHLGHFRRDALPRFVPQVVEWLTSRL